MKVITVNTCTSLINLITPSPYTISVFFGHGGIRFTVLSNIPPPKKKKKIRLRQAKKPIEMYGGSGEGGEPSRKKNPIHHVICQHFNNVVVFLGVLNCFDNFSKCCQQVKKHSSTWKDNKKFWQPFLGTNKRQHFGIFVGGGMNLIRLVYIFCWF